LTFLCAHSRPDAEPFACFYGVCKTVFCDSAPGAYDAENGECFPVAFVCWEEVKPGTGTGAVLAEACVPFCKRRV
jgi:hypothetical protein